MADRIFYGAWTCADDMHRAFRTVLSEYPHADSSLLLAPYPLGENPPARVVYAASPETTAKHRPLIVMVRGGYFFVQRRMDRWSANRIWSSDMLQDLRVKFVDRVAAAGLKSLLARAFRIELDNSQFTEARCTSCGNYLAGEVRICGGCADREQRNFRHFYPDLAMSWVLSGEKAARV